MPMRDMIRNRRKLPDFCLSRQDLVPAFALPGMNLPKESWPDLYETTGGANWPRKAGLSVHHLFQRHDLKKSNA